VLRPGGVTPEQLRAVIGEVEIDRAVLEKIDSDAPVASPGMKYKHYAPKANVSILKGSLEEFAEYVKAQSAEGVAVLCFDGEEKAFGGIPCITYGAPDDGGEQARRLFDALRRLDETAARTVFARCPNTEGMGLAVYNRLIRAAGFSLIQL
jgi:L-threonylcarbamoyladenylate synthase